MFGILGQSLLVHIKSSRDVTLELINVPYLIPTVRASEWRGRICGNDDLVEVLKSLVKLLLLFVDYADAEADLIRPLKVWGYGEDCQKSLKRVV